MALTLNANNVECSLLKRINNCGRNIAVRCIDDEVYENEVILILLLHHKFRQLGLDLEEGCVLILPDYTADFFIQLKMELLCSEDSITNLFFQESELNYGDDINDSTESRDILIDTIQDATDDESTELESHSTIENKTTLEISDIDDVHTVTPLSFNCGQCDAILSSKKSLNGHIQSIHEGVRHSCDQCEFTTTTKGHVRKHKLTKHFGLRYYCDECEFQATRRRILKQHVQSIHEGVQLPSVKCDQCDAVLKTNRTLKQHVQVIHEGAQLP